MKKILFVFLLFISYPLIAKDIVSIVPKPVKVEALGGDSFIFSKSTTIYYDNKELLTPIEIFTSQVRDIFKYTPVVIQGKGSRNYINIATTKSMEKEEYKLNVGVEGVSLTAGSAQGVLHGLQSLRQILFQCKKGEAADIAAMKIVDKPFFAYRGMMLDVCRHFRDVTDVKRFIDILSMHKVNTFHWHLTDDQGWRIPIDKYPLLTDVGAERAYTIVGHARDSKLYDGKPYGKGLFYTKEQIKEVIAYAANRNIEILPEIEMPGHALAALAAYPSLGCVGKDYKVSPTWGIFDDVFCIGKEGTYSFFEDVLSEVIELFPSKYIHIGGDECRKKRWEECPECQKRMKDNNLKDAHELQSYFMKRMEKFVNSKGKSIIGWEEILEGGISPTATLMSWKSPQAGIEAAKKGNKVIMVPSKFAYLDYYQSEDKDNEPYAIGGYVPVSKVYSFDPYAELNDKEKKGILGVQANLWTEYIPTMSKVEYMVLPRMAAMAENGWSYDRKDYNDFEGRIQDFVKLYDLYNYRYGRHIIK